VIAGPVEATALGNIAMQMLATGTVSSLRDARAIIERSFPVERFEPRNPERWEAHYPRFTDYCRRNAATDHGLRTTHHAPRTTDHGPRTTDHGSRVTDHRTRNTE
jgi:hypothetical protein